MIALAQATDNATGNDFEDTRRITEDDPDYQRLHNATVARLQRSLRQYARALLQGEPGADTRFIHRHIGIIRAAYEAAHREGQRDYWPAVSNRVVRHRYIVPDQEQVQKRLAFYALGSVLKMAHEVKVYVRNGQQQALSETIKLFNPNHDAKGRFATGGGKPASEGDIKAAHARVAAAQERVRQTDAARRVEFARVRQERGMTPADPMLGSIVQSDPAARAANSAFRDANMKLGTANRGLNDLLGTAMPLSTGSDVVEQENIRQANQHLFGRNLSNDEMRSLVGAPSGAEVHVASDGEELSIHMTGPHGEYDADRTVSKDGRSVYISNNVFTISEEEQGKGLGSSILASQVEGASSLGVKYLDTYGARQDGPNGFNGYYTWPRLGYDAAFPSELRGGLPASFGTINKMSDLMKTQEGRDWWKVNGTGIHLTFDLRSGSRSRRVLDAYRADKKAKGGK